MMLLIKTPEGFGGKKSNIQLKQMKISNEEMVKILFDEVRKLKTNIISKNNDKDKNKMEEKINILLEENKRNNLIIEKEKKENEEKINILINKNEELEARIYSLIENNEEIEKKLNILIDENKKLKKIDKNKNCLKSKMKENKANQNIIYFKSNPQELKFKETITNECLKKFTLDNKFDIYKAFDENCYLASSLESN